MAPPAQSADGKNFNSQQSLNTQLRERDELTLAVGRNGAIVIKRAQRRYQLDELLSKITARNRHDETDWGPPVVW
jgi:antitoxin component of MazEF toxin-antitoxin module